MATDYRRQSARELATKLNVKSPGKTRDIVTTGAEGKGGEDRRLRNMCIREDARSHGTAEAMVNLQRKCLHGKAPQSPHARRFLGNSAHEQPPCNNAG